MKMIVSFLVKLLSYIALLVFFFLSSVFPQQLSLTQLTFSDSTHDGYPYWTPDGKYIFYSSGSKRSCTTMKISSDGGEPVKMTEYFSQHAQVSPDGFYMVFDGEVGTRVFLSSVQGGVPIRIVPEDILIKMSGMPIWAPDGRSVAFHSFGVLWTVNLTTSEFRKIFWLEGKKILPYDWTSDGRFIYGSALDTASRTYDLWKIPLNGRKPEQLTFLDGRQTKPSLSPDDSLVVFSSNHGGNTDLWIMRSMGGNPAQVTFFAGDENNPGYDVEPSWSPDGNYIAFSSTRSGYWAIWIMKIDMKFIKEKLNAH